MLFNSYEFVFVFLPVVLLGYYRFVPDQRRLRQIWLVVASLCFLGYWRIDYLPVLLVSITVNHVVGRLILNRAEQPRQQAFLLASGIAANLGALCYFKYLFPMLGFLHAIGASDRTWGQITLPLGISFYTFTQIGYLIECKQGLVKSRSVLDYMLFVTFFPHLIAGPILWNHDIMPQYAKPETYRLNLANVSTGLTWFIFGMAKKCLLADNFAPAADYGFAQTGELGMIASWHTALAYSMQLYFDFSGYSDMAIGLALMFNVRFPLNFNSPYKATSIIDFWQRWHMSLTRYLTMYLYNPVALAITRRRAARGLSISNKGARTPIGFITMIAVPTVFTMGLAGIWHGAGLQFIIFGLLHAIYLTVNHAWRVFRRRSASRAPGPVSVVSGVLLTYICVLVAQIFFRAESSGSAAQLLAGMAGFHGIANGLFADDTLLAGAQRLEPDLFGRVGTFRTAADAVVLFLPIAAAFAAVWTLPNTQQILAQANPGETAVNRRDRDLIRWQPNMAWAIWLSVMAVLSIGSFEQLQRFIYFQF
jgi:D-alanyl-lipoteichoic acid acyltransferase DltB (MBOAT superfamily)